MEDECRLISRSALALSHDGVRTIRTTVIQNILPAEPSASMELGSQDRNGQDTRRVGPERNKSVQDRGMAQDKQTLSGTSNVPQNTTSDTLLRGNSLLTASMHVKARYKCREPDCLKTFAHDKNIPRHLRVVHGKKTRRRGRPPKSSAEEAAESCSVVEESRLAPNDALPEPQPSNRLARTSSSCLDERWTHQPWYQRICGRRYHWNRNGLLEKLLHLPRLEKHATTSEHGLARIMNVGELPTKSEADALQAFRNRKSHPTFRPSTVR